MKKIYLFVGNHGSLDGIEDCVQILSKVFNDRGFNLGISDVLVPNSVNLIVDEFSGLFENKRIADFCNKSKENKCIFILTEFINCKFSVTSFNHFNGVFSAALISLANVCLRYLRSDLPNLRIRDLVQLFIFIPVFILLFLVQIFKVIISILVARNPRVSIQKLYSKFNNLIYLHMRFLGLQSMIKYAQGVILLHPSIKIDVLNSEAALKMNNLGILYPELDKSRILTGRGSQNLLIEITGSITPYRQAWISRFNKAIQIMGGSNTFKYCVAFPFSVAKITSKNLRGSFSLHPMQSLSWPYCSPTRIYRALMVDGSIPILARNTLQHEIEDVCLHVFSGNFPARKTENPFLIQIYISKILKLIERIYRDNQFKMEYLEPRIDKYQLVAKKNNDALMKAIEKIASQ